MWQPWSLTAITNLNLCVCVIQVCAIKSIQIAPFHKVYNILQLFYIRLNVILYVFICRCADSHVCVVLFIWLTILLVYNIPSSLCCIAKEHKGFSCLSLHAMELQAQGPVPSCFTMVSGVLVHVLMLARQAITHSLHFILYITSIYLLYLQILYWIKYLKSILIQNLISLLLVFEI